jgi:polar amino acid transport system substrate-binding protein
MQFLEQGKIDLMIATMNDKPDRRKVVYIVEPSYYASSVNVLAPKSAKLKDWTDLKGKKVCMIQGAWYNKQLQQDYGMEDVAFKGTAEVFTALKANNCVAFAYDDTLILASLLEPEWKDYEMPLKSILEDPWGLAVKLGEEKFYKFMSDMIVEWHRTGRIVELEKKYGMGNTAFAVKMVEKYKK